ncbi:unnamed protein product [Cyclocybe aegerita]|uniref:Uncharacterized protein n=1 Tax=Cyclocybe aegerita TaxID=1973307 RepID=A0A8S0XIN2_CYCAE|nr:unnamed protein product [Cyclocybe aegerita]
MKRQLSLTEEKAAGKSNLVQDAIITDLKKRFEEQAEELVGVRRAAEGAKHAFEIATQLKESVSAVEKAEWEKQRNQLMRALRVKIVTLQQCEATLKDEKVNTEIERRSLHQAIDKLTEELREEFQNDWYKVQMEEKAVAKGMEILRALEDRRKSLEGAEEENGAVDG